MEVFLAVTCLLLVLALVWVYSIARDAKDEAHHLWLRMEGQKQQLIEHGYRLHALEQKKGKKNGKV